MGPRTGLDTVVKENFPEPTGSRTLVQSVFKQYTTELSWLLLSYS